MTIRRSFLLLFAASLLHAQVLSTTSLRRSFHRGFEYVPFSESNVYGPIDELWT